MPLRRKRKQIAVALSDAQHSWLRSQAQVHGTSVAEMVRRCVDIRMIGPLGNVAVPSGASTMKELRQVFPEAFREVPDDAPVTIDAG